jgi:hypothetical protein
MIVLEPWLRVYNAGCPLLRGLLRRLPPERVEGFVMQASEKLAHEPKWGAYIVRFALLLSANKLAEKADNVHIESVLTSQPEGVTASP